MRWSPRNKRSAIGLDLGAHDIKAVQLVQQGGQWWIARATCFRRDNDKHTPDSQDIARVREVLIRQGFAGNKVVMMLPPDMLRTSPMELPTSKQPISVEQLAMMEFARIHHMTPGTFEMAWWPVQTPQRSRDRTHVLAVGCPHDQSMPMLALLGEHHLQSTRLVPHVHALSKVYQHLDSDSQDAAVVLDLGWSAARLVVMHQGVVIYDRQMKELGAHVIQHGVCRQLGVDNDWANQVLHHDDAMDEQDRQWSQSLLNNTLPRYMGQLHKEIQMALSYAAHRYPNAPLGRLWMLGGGASIARIRDHLQQSINMDVHLARPRDILPGKPEASARLDCPQLTLATALALMEVA